MQHDEVVWQIINQSFCSFKTKIARERTFCQNPFNVTGLCLRSACPLANSLYATIREEDGVCYLFIKTPERAHSPKNLWEKITLPHNYTKALEIVSTHLEYFPKYLVHRNKQRLTKIHQMLIRMRRLRLKEKPKLVTINTKVEQREKGRERKALKAAQLERSIEKELLERLKQVTDNEIYNYPEQQYTKVINKASDKFLAEEGENEDEEEEDGEEEEPELEEELEAEDAEDEDGEYNVEYIEDFEESDAEEDDEDIEELGSLPSRFSAPSLSYYSKSSAVSKRSHDDHDDEDSGHGSKRARKDVPSGGKKDSKKNGSSKRGKGTRVEIEYEEETEEPRQKLRANSGRNTSDMDFNF
jgi:protein MAK16